METKDVFDFLIKEQKDQSDITLQFLRVIKDIVNKYEEVTEGQPLLRAKLLGEFNSLVTFSSSLIGAYSIHSYGGTFRNQQDCACLLSSAHGDKFHSDIHSALNAIHEKDSSKLADEVICKAAQ